MKKYLLGIFAIVLAIGFSAFTVNSSNVSKQDVQSYTWHKYNPAGTAELIPTVEFEGSLSQAKDAFQCPDGIQVYCARAYEGEIPLDLFIMKTPE